MNIININCDDNVVNNRKEILEEIKNFMMASCKNSLKKRGNLFILTMDELKHLVELIKKLYNN